MLLANKQVAIVGGGPAGLTLARLLQQQGVQVNVYERDVDPFVRQQGATLDLHYESGLKALRAGGLMDEFAQHYRPGADRITITDNQAVVRYAQPDDELVQDLTSEEARPEIDRGPLRSLLIASLEPDTIVWNAKLADINPKEKGWTLHFADATTSYADFVVAADGANSRLRKHITAIKPIYSGITVVDGNISNAARNAPRLWELTNGGKVIAMWQGKAIYLSAKGEGSLNFYTGTREAEEWATTSGIDFTNREQVFSWFKERYADWSAEWHELFGTDQGYYVARPQYYFPTDQSWPALSNLTMLGDAAHAMPPFAGEGVNQAMQDALELYEALCKASFDTIQQAVASFEDKMRSRAAIVTEETLVNTEAMHSKTNLQFVLHFFEGA